MMQKLQPSASEGSPRWVTASLCFALCLVVARGNQRIKSQEYVQRCWRAGLGEECLNPEQRWNLFLFMWERISTRIGEVAVVRPRCWTVVFLTWVCLSFHMACNFPAVLEEVFMFYTEMMKKCKSKSTWQRYMSPQTVDSSVCES